jgi:hypothetical protein
MKKLVEQFIKQYDKAVTQVELIQKDIDKKRELIEGDKRDAKLARDCSTILTELVREQSNIKIGEIENIVNEGLKVVFSDNIEIKIISSILNNKTTYHIDITQNGVHGTQESFGGGVLAVISLCLRVVMIIYCKRDRILFLDESLGFVSEVYQPNLSNFISQLCKRLGFNITLISHQPKMVAYADRIYEAYKGKDGTEFRLTTSEKLD